MCDASLDYTVIFIEAINEGEIVERENRGIEGKFRSTKDGGCSYWGASIMIKRKSTIKNISYFIVLLTKFFMKFLARNNLTIILVFLIKR